MFMHKLIAASLMLAFSAPPTVGTAAELRGPHGPAGLFLGPPADLESIDTDGDGKVSLEEMLAARNTEFESIDTDDNGYLSLTELRGWTAAKITARFQSRDTDRNGSLSSDEFAAGQSARDAPMANNLFRLADTNSDGQLSSDEFSTMAGDATAASFHFAAMDSDGDGKVSVEEYATPPQHPNARRARERVSAD